MFPEHSTGVVTVTAEMTVVADLGSPGDGASEAEQHGGEVDSDGVEVEVLGHLYSTVQYSTVQYTVLRWRHGDTWNT